MNIHLATAYPTKWSYLPRFRELAQMDGFGEHHLTASDQGKDRLFAHKTTIKI